MRGFAVIAAVSVGVHVAAMVALDRIPRLVRLLPEVAEEETPVVEIEVVEVVEPMEVAIVSVEPEPERVAAARPREVPRAAAASAAESAAAAVSASAAATESESAAAAESGTGTGTGTGMGTGTGVMGMRRGPAGADLSLPVESGVIGEILARPPPPEVPETGTLEKNRDGTYTKRDLTFTAKVDADGHVSNLDDKPNVKVKLHIPDPRKVPGAVANHITNWYEDPTGVSNRTGQDTVKAKESTAATGADGQSSEKSDGRVYTILSGGFDVTDAVMRWANQDPYDARKRAFLEETFDERVEIGRVHRKKQLDQADQIMLAHLDRMWSSPDLPIDDKRALVFELWDECAEDGGQQLEAGGAKARAALLRWIGVHLPAGSDQAFTEDELRRYNKRRRSKAKFAPYR